MGPPGPYNEKTLGLIQSVQSSDQAGLNTSTTRNDDPDRTGPGPVATRPVARPSLHHLPGN